MSAIWNGRSHIAKKDNATFVPLYPIPEASYTIHRYWLCGLGFQINVKDMVWKMIASPTPNRDATSGLSIPREPNSVFLRLVDEFDDLSSTMVAQIVIVGGISVVMKGTMVCAAKFQVKSPPSGHPFSLLDCSGPYIMTTSTRLPNLVLFSTELSLDISFNKCIIP